MQGAGNCIDHIRSAAIVCRAAINECDVAELCDGSSKDCPPDRFVPAGNLCDGYGGVVAPADESSKPPREPAPKPKPKRKKKPKKNPSDPVKNPGTTSNKKSAATGGTESSSTVEPPITKERPQVVLGGNGVMKPTIPKRQPGAGAGGNIKKKPTSPARRPGAGSGGGSILVRKPTIAMNKLLPANRPGANGQLGFPGRPAAKPNVQMGQQQKNQKKKIKSVTTSGGKKKKKMRAVSTSGRKKTNKKTMKAGSMKVKRKQK